VTRGWESKPMRSSRSQSAVDRRFEECEAQKGEGGSMNQKSEGKKSRVEMQPQPAANGRDRQCKSVRFGCVGESCLGGRRKLRMVVYSRSLVWCGLMGVLVLVSRVVSDRDDWPSGHLLPMRRPYHPRAIKPEA